MGFTKNFRYKKFNKTLFKNKQSSNDGVILIEFNAFNDFHVVNSVLANFLKKKFRCKIKGFFNYSVLSSTLVFSLKNKLKWFMGKFLNLGYFSIYNSFGVDEIFRPKISKSISKISKIFFDKKFKKIKNRNNLLNFKINNILVGDLIYDTYLKSKKVPTLSIESNDFKIFFLEFLNLYFFWHNYFKKNKVNAVITSHLSYSYAIPLRIANKQNILSLVATSKSIIKYSKNTYYGYGDFKNYQRLFLKFSKEEQIKKLKLSEQNFKKRFNGNTGLKGDKVLFYSNKSSFNNYKIKKEYIKKNNRSKILICTHDFFDAVHLYGKFIFPDFYNWLNYLGEFSKSTNYDWYIKNHPRVGGKFLISHKATEKIVIEILRKYPNIKLLPDNLSHKYIMRKGINLVLTVYGTVGVEYPFFGIPVLNAGPNNPHSAFGFNHHPKNLEEFNKILKKIPKMKNINKIRNEILIYYYMNYLNPNDNWFFPNYYKMIKSIGGYENLPSDRIYDYFVKNITKKDIINIEKNLNQFLINKNYRI